MSIIATIQRRTSVRSFAREPVPHEAMVALRAVLASLTAGPLGTPARFLLVNLTELDKEESRRLGTYGFIRGTNLFVCGAVKRTERALEDFGYCLEKIILEATALGLGTCWMAMTYNKPAFSAKIGLQADERMPAITPLGLPAARRSIVELTLKLFTRPRQRKAWEQLFFDGQPDVPLTREKAGAYAEPLECVRLAPSAVNCQPWRIVKAAGKDTYHFCSDPGKPEDTGRLHTGIAMAHFELAARERGLAGAWETPQLSTAPGGVRYSGISWKGAETEIAGVN
jgi:hypothetical protein